MTRFNQKGFALVETLLILIILAIICGTGYYVCNSNKKANDTFNAASKSAKSSPAKNNNVENSKSLATVTVKLADGHVAFNLPSKWEVHTVSKPADECYTNVDNTEKCLDSALLVLKSEEFTSTDQFFAKVSVYKKDDSKTAKDWFINDIHDGSDTDHTFVDFTTAQGLRGFIYHAPYTDEDRTQYGVVTNSYGVTVYCNFFKGNHYSFQSTKDYSIYSFDVELIAKSLVIK